MYIFKLAPNHGEMDMVEDRFEATALLIVARQASEKPAQEIQQWLEQQARLVGCPEDGAKVFAHTVAMAAGLVKAMRASAGA
jgi:hypothetical protein